MGEALIIRSGGGSQSSGGYVPKTVLINSNQTWTVPKAKNQEFMVRLFGAGGLSKGYINVGNDRGYCGGGGGYMANNLLKLNIGEVIPITIGDISNGNVLSTGYTANGGITSFGTYLAASGGEGASNNVGGSGGTGGGGIDKGGDAQYGGGGFGKIGGNGGIYGGGGGAYSASNIGTSTGGYGNGGYFSMKEDRGITFNFTPYPATDGLNTMNMASEIDFAGHGKAGSGSYGGDGGGGYGGNGGSNFGGGGGYGAKGGNGAVGRFGNFIIAGGGGGGYGNDGGDGVRYTGTNIHYYCGGGGGYGPEGYGHGGGGYINGSRIPPKPGVCIITYMEPIQ